MVTVNSAMLWIGFKQRGRQPEQSGLREWVDGQIIDAWLEGWLDDGYRPTDWQMFNVWIDVVDIWLMDEQMDTWYVYLEKLDQPEGTVWIQLS